MKIHWECAHCLGQTFLTLAAAQRHKRRYRAHFIWQVVTRPTRAWLKAMKGQR